jgi:lytic murein transglycosylase
MPPDLCAPMVATLILAIGGRRVSGLSADPSPLKASDLLQLSAAAAREEEDQARRPGAALLPPTEVRRRQPRPLRLRRRHNRRGRPRRRLRTHPPKRPPHPPAKRTAATPLRLRPGLPTSEEGRRGGVSRQAIASIDGMPLNQTIIARDRKQGFFAQSFVDFQNKLATPNRVQSSKRKVAEHRDTFARAKSDFGVPPSVITGFWALESDFGAGMGKFPIMPALVTLAYDCRRGEMFTEELIAALQIIDRGDMTPSGMIGSWAGEIGQTQFLPTRYLDYAIDYDGDGRINLFNNDDDVIGSTANYMKNLGWRPDEPWLEEVRVTRDLPWEQADLAIKLPRSQWAQWGIQRPDGGAIPADNLQASLLLPMGRNGPAFLAYPNFNVYTEWNQSLNYATTAAISRRRTGHVRGRGDTNGLDGAQTKQLQQILASRGYDVGKIDGLAGSKTRAAVKDMQLKLGLPPDSYATPELLAALRSRG